MSNTFFGTNSAQFMDPVHGGIGALSHEVSCIDHPLFQRLRYILQNDVAHYVFSGATHTRLNHSIGTMHVAGKLYRSLIEQYTGEAQPDFKITSQHIEAIYYVYSCFRLAALLHDTGHFPFSHEFEESSFIKTILSDKDVLSDFWGESDLYRHYASKTNENQKFHFSHEDYSLAVAYKILNDINKKNKLPVEIDDVLSLMENHSHVTTDRWEKMSGLLFEVLEGRSDSRSNYDKTFISEAIREFFSLMISGEIDVDKMDYLLRDSYFSGAKYGIYNLDHLISTLRIGFDSKTKWVGLAILEKGVVALEDFVYSRFQIYQNMWSHKAVVRCKLLLADAINEVMMSPPIQLEVKNYMKDSNKFSVFTDHFFLEKFRMKHLEDGYSRCTDFLFRAKMKHLEKLVDPKVSEIHSAELKHTATEKGKIVSRNTFIKFSEIKNREFEDIRVIVNDKSSQRTLVEITKQSRFFEKFSGKLVVNFYAQRN